MTVCVSVKVSEGLVLAADSTAAIEGKIGDGPPGILKTYDHMRKLAHVKDYPIGTLTWGTAHVGTRTVDSLIREFEHGLPSLQEEGDKCKEQRMRGEEPEPYRYSVRKIAKDLVAQILERYQREFSDRPQKEQPGLGLLVSGYSPGQFFPEQWLAEIPLNPHLINVVIGRFRFVIGAPLCGGDIDVAVITPDNFTWVRRKSWKLDT